VASAIPLVAHDYLMDLLCMFAVGFLGTYGSSLADTAGQNVITGEYQAYDQRRSDQVDYKTSILTQATP
jgi:hypothetical protein